MPSYGHFDYMTTPQGRNGILFAKNAMEFASLGLILEQKLVSEQRTIRSVIVNSNSPVSINLYCIAIELALKSLALRSGATVVDCKDASHKISKIISLLEKHKIKIPELLDRKLNNDKSFFNRLLGTRYPEFDPEEVITYHKNYPEMISEILEVPCPIPLQFEGGGAMSEIKKLVADLKRIA